MIDSAKRVSGGKTLRRIYFDNEPLMGRWPARVTGELRVFARLARLADVDLLVPESVVVEHKHSTMRQAMEFMKKAASNLDRANNLLNGLALEQRLAELDVEAIGAAHDQAVEKAKHSHRFLTIPVTAKPLRDFVREAASHGLTFKEHDAGFRDAVHLHSVLEHLATNRLLEGEEAIFYTRDSVLSAAAAEAGAALRLTTQKESDILDRLQAMIAAPEGEQLIRLAEDWSPVILNDVRKHLLEPVVQGLESTGLIPHSYSWDPSDFETTGWVEGGQAFAPIDEENKNRWAGWIPIRIRGNVVVDLFEGAAASKRPVDNSVVEAQIGLSVAITADRLLQIREILYESASLDWVSINGGERIDSGSPPDDLLRHTVATHPQG